MIAAIDNGDSLILFPEGTRGESKKEQKLKPGIGFILEQRPDIEIVPVYMNGMGKAMPKGDCLIVPFNSRLVFGKPKRIKFDSISDVLNEIKKDLEELKILANT